MSDRPVESDRTAEERLGARLRAAEGLLRRWADGVGQLPSGGKQPHERTPEEMRADLAARIEWVRQVGEETDRFLAGLPVAEPGAGKAERKQAGIENIMGFIKATGVERELQTKPDITVAALLEEHIWGPMDMTTPHSALVCEAIRRLRKEPPYLLKSQPAPPPTVPPPDNFRVQAAPPPESNASGPAPSPETKETTR